MKVFATKKVPNIAREILENHQIELVEWDSNELIQKEILLQIIPEYDGLLVVATKIDAEIIEAGKSLKIIALVSAGYEKVDVATATKNKIPVSNTPDVLSFATASVAFLLIQSVARQLSFNLRRVNSGNWGNSFVENLGVEIQGKTLGILGLGRIGFMLAELCQKAFKMKIIYHNRSFNLLAENELGAKKVSMQELLSQSDIISIHTNLTPETQHLINSDSFKKMKKSAIIINTSRGKVIDEKALIEALENGEIWGAGLDVTDPEPMNPENPLLQMKNVVVFPHIGSATQETRNAMAQLAAENVVLALEGKEVKTPVNPEVYTL